jgi:S1-C subfamily serine protease
LDELRTANAVIEAEGTSVDPEFGMVFSSLRSGSGFIFDPTDIAATNNHIVAGSSALLLALCSDQDAPERIPWLTNAKMGLA